MYIKRNTDARSHNHCCHGKAITIIYFVCVFLAFFYPALNGHAPYYIFICGLSGFTIFFPYYLINGTILGEKINHEMCVLISSTTIVCETFLILRRIQ